MKNCNIFVVISQFEEQKFILMPKSNAIHMYWQIQRDRDKAMQSIKKKYEHETPPKRIAFDYLWNEMLFKLFESVVFGSINILIAKNQQMMLKLFCVQSNWHKLKITLN